MKKKKRKGKKKKQRRSGRKISRESRVANPSTFYQSVSVLQWNLPK
jgi:hypothetical protein